MTGGLWTFVPDAYNVLVHCDPEQRRRYLEPSLRGERSGSYAITEPGAGSDARAVRATAVRDAATDEWVLDGEKWFVTGNDDCDFMIFHALAVEGDERRPTLFLVDYDTPGLTVVGDPDHTHTFADRHPQYRLEGVRVPASQVLGGVGRADELTNEWFVEERIHIGARCSGAMERLLTLAVEWATERIQFGQRIYDFQGVSFPLADSAADAVCRPAADPGGRLAGRLPAPTRRSSTPRPRWPSSSPRRPPGAAPIASSRSSGVVATTGPSPRSGSCASCASTGSGRAPRRSSASSSREPLERRGVDRVVG